MGAKVFISCAEVSGDRIASLLVKSLAAMDPTIQVVGLGGPMMRDAGAEVMYETVRDAAMGAHGLKRVFELMPVVARVKRRFRTGEFSVLVCVDSPSLNLHLARAARKAGMRVVYFVAPQLWAWREGRMKRLRRDVDKVACVLPFEEDYFQQHEVDAVFVGHPLLDQVRAGRHAGEARFPDRPPVIGLLPGSRVGEVKAHLPRMLEVAARIRAQFPAARFLVPTTQASTPLVKDATRGEQSISWAEDAFDELVPKCDLCLTVSGTSTLHVALHGVPMVIAYVVKPAILRMLLRRLVKVRTFGIVNLLAIPRDQWANPNPPRVVPEFIPWLGPVDPVADCMLGYLNHPERLSSQRQALGDLVDRVGGAGASAQVAQIVVDLLRRLPAKP